MKLERIRDILLRQIAEKNKEISSYIHSVYGQDYKGYSNVHTRILHSFLGGNRNLINEINTILESNSKYRAHNYFDINTLYSYDRYLNTIKVTMNMSKNTLNPTKIQNIIERCGVAQKNNAQKAESGYYNLSQPVTFEYQVTDNGKVLNPRKALTEEEFVKKYRKSSESCRNEVEFYIDSKRNPEMLEEYDTLMEEYAASAEYIQYNYEGKVLKLMVDSKEQYFGEDMEPVTCIKASNGYGFLYTTRDLSNNVYNGMLFDSEGDIITNKESGEEFFPNVKYSVDSAKKSKKNEKKISSRDAEMEDGMDSWGRY